MTEKSFVFDNKREHKIHELYLNKKGADVNFVFDADTDHSKKVPAHKIILSLHSPVFDTMFYGSIPEQVDVPIVDTSETAFGEFLQFFYLDEVRLSSANIVHVTNLCKKYEMSESAKLCETAFQKSLTSNDMCWGYSIALWLEQENLIEFCEERIKQSPRKIIKSDSFLECDGKLLSKILNLVSLDWGAMETVIACMEWSKAQCKYNDLEINPATLRDQLGDIFNQISFYQIKTKQISDHIAYYDGLFTVQQLETFYQTWFPNQLNPFDLKQHKYELLNIPPGKFLECNRKVAFKLYLSFERVNSLISTTVFSSDTTLLLTGFNMFHAGDEFKYNVYAEFKYSVHEGTDPTSTDKLIFEGHSESRRIDLPKEVVISTGKFYRVSVSYLKFNGFRHKINSLSNEVQLDRGIKITFSPRDVDKITELFFQTPLTTSSKLITHTFKNKHKLEIGDTRKN